MIISRHHRTPLFWLALAACLGILVARDVMLAPFWILQAAVLCAILSFVTPLRRIFLLLLVFFSFWFYTQARSTYGSHDLRALLSDSRQTASLSGMISEFPTLKQNYKGESFWEFVVDIDTVEQFGEKRPTSGQVLVKLPTTQSAAPLYGDIVRWTGNVASPSIPMNKGRFNYRRYLSAKDIYFVSYVEPGNIEWIARDQGSWLMKMAGTVRQAMISTISENPWWPDKQLKGPWLTFESRSEITAVMAAMLFGYRDGISSDVQDSFRDTGTLHLFAVSGQNVAVITVILVVLLQAMGLIRWRWGWLLIFPVFIFCLSTGMQPSAARAFLMAAILFVGWILYRPIQPYNIVGAAALVLLILNPYEVYDIGFQLSFVVVLALLALAGPIADFVNLIYRADPWIPSRLIGNFQKFKYHIFRIVCLTFGVSVAAWIGSAPLSAWYFHQFSPVTVIANTLIAPLANAIIIISGLSVIAAPLWGMGSLVLNSFNSILVQIILWIVTLLAQVPGGHFNITLDPARLLGKTTSIHILATEGSAPTIIEHRGKSWLIDPGSENTWRFHIDPLRRSLGINSWKGILITQQTASHMGSLISQFMDISSDFYAETGMTTQSPIYTNWLKLATDNRQGRQFWRAGDKISESGSFEFNVLWPQPGSDSPRAEDDSLVTLIRLQGVTILWAGSISPEIEKNILAANPSLHADILVESPHPKLSNLTPEWLNAISPQAIIRPNFHYAKEKTVDESFLQQMAAQSVEVYELGKSGSLEITPKWKHFFITDFATGNKRDFEVTDRKLSLPSMPPETAPVPEPPPTPQP